MPVLLKRLVFRGQFSVYLLVKSCNLLHCFTDKIPFALLPHFILPLRRNSISCWAPNIVNSFWKQYSMCSFSCIQLFLLESLLQTGRNLDYLLLECYCSATYHVRVRWVSITNFKCSYWITSLFVDVFSEQCHVEYLIFLGANGFLPYPWQLQVVSIGSHCHCCISTTIS